MKSSDADAHTISARELQAANELISPGKVVASAQVQALVTSIASSTTAPAATRPRPPSIPAPQLPTARPTSLSSVMTSNPFFEKESVAPSAAQDAARPSSDGRTPSVIDVGRALFAFHAETATDMEMLPNDKIEVYEKNEDGNRVVCLFVMVGCEKFISILRRLVSRSKHSNESGRHVSEQLHGVVDGATPEARRAFPTIHRDVQAAVAEHDCQRKLRPSSAGRQHDRFHQEIGTRACTLGSGATAKRYRADACDGGGS
jgi:hypothetical protein